MARQKLNKAEREALHHLLMLADDALASMRKPLLLAGGPDGEVVEGKRFLRRLATVLGPLCGIGVRPEGGARG